MTFKPGRPWLDTDGKPIEAHFGGVFWDNGTYYWYGTNWDGPTIHPGTLPDQNYTWYDNYGISIYSSKDLYTWKYENTVLKAGDHPLLEKYHALIRPKIIKNDSTGKYVLLAGMTSPDFNSANDVVLAVADSPAGPYELQGKLGWAGEPNLTGVWAGLGWKGAANDPAERIRCFDMGLYKDDDGKAYLMTAHRTTILHELSDDYLSVKRADIMEGANGEAPAVFKKDGTYYLVMSSLTGYRCNENYYLTAADLKGPWKKGGPLPKGEGKETTYESQVTFVLPVEGRKDTFIFMSDRFGSPDAFTVPDVSAATYVWLPIDFTGSGQISISWQDEWTL